MDKLRVLFVSFWFPYPPDNGSRIRVYSLIKALSRAHDVHLVSMLQDDSDPRNAGQLEEYCRVVSLQKSEWFQTGSLKSALGLLSTRPRSAVATYSLAMERAVRDAIRSVNPDVIVASTLGIVEYIPRDCGVPAVLEQHNCEYQILKQTAQSSGGLLRRVMSNLSWRKSAAWEARMCRRFDAVTEVSEQDRKLMLAVAPDMKHIHVVTNGVDTGLYDSSAWAPQPDRLVYNGAVTYGANLDAVRYFAAEVYPRLLQHCPSMKLYVTGKTDGVDLHGVRECPGIELTGYLEDIRPTLSASVACIVPLRFGGGSRLKILEAMAAGVPVIATSVGAEGIEAVPGEHILIADDPDEFAELICTVASEKELARRISTNARKLVEEQYDWSLLGERFARIVEATHSRLSAASTGT